MLPAALPPCATTLPLCNLQGRYLVQVEGQEAPHRVLPENLRTGPAVAAPGSGAPTVVATDDVLDDAFDCIVLVTDTIGARPARHAADGTTR